MKAFLLIFCFFISSDIFCQKPTLNKLWIGDANNYLRVDTDAIRVECFYTFQSKSQIYRQAYRYSLIADTLRVTAPNFSSSKYDDFIIKNLSTDQLKLISLNPNSLILAFTETPKKTLNFRDRKQVQTDTIAFEKLLFNSTNCFGTCTAMSLQIDKDKQLKFVGGKYAVKDGLYTSTLSNALYNKLLYILSISELDKIETNGDENIDLPTYTLEVHYNNKIKFLKSCILPFATNELLDYLLKIPNQVKFKPAEKIEIKFSR